MTLKEALTELDRNNFIVYKDNPNKQYKIREATAEECARLIYCCEEYVNNVMYEPDKNPDEFEPFTADEEDEDEMDNESEHYGFLDHKFTVTGNELLATLKPEYCHHNEDYIAYLYVSPESRRKGIAEQLLKYAYDHSDHGLVLTVSKNNTNAINLYKKLGFKFFKPDNKYANPDYEKTNYHMVWKK